MNQKQFIETVCKSFGIYFLIQIFIEVKQVVFFVVSAVNPDISSGNFLIMGEQLVLDAIFYSMGAWMLISRSSWIASKMTSNNTEPVQLDIKKSKLLEIVIVAIGVLLVVDAIPEILGKMGQYLYFNEFDRNEQNRFWTLKERRADILYAFFKLGVGIITVSNGKNVARWLKK